MTTKLLTFLFLLCVTCFAQAITITVGGTNQCGGPCDYSVIQTALDNANPGDDIEVYGDGGTNIYSESLTIGDANITLTGMLADRGVTITSGAARTIYSNFPNTIIENLTVDSSRTATGAEMFYFAGNGDNAIVRNNNITCTPSASGTTEIAAIYFSFANDGSSVLNNYISCKRRFTIETGDPTNITIKYNHFDNAGWLYDVGLGNGGSGHVISYNYFQIDSVRVNWYAGIRLRSISNYTIEYNLFVYDYVMSDTDSAIQLRAFGPDEGGGQINNNTIVLDTANHQGYCFGGYDDAATIGNPTTRIEDNICQNADYVSGDFAAVTVGDIQQVFNYHVDYQTGVENIGDPGWVFANNTDTAVDPGFVGSGIIWQTDGTDLGTTSEWYALNPGAPALTACTGGGQCGAFGVDSGPGPALSLPNIPRSRIGWSPGTLFVPR